MPRPPAPLPYNLEHFAEDDSISWNSRNVLPYGMVIIPICLHYNAIRAVQWALKEAAHGLGFTFDPGEPLADE
jgi:hypothetical protein